MMARYCTYCELIYRRSYHNCPACGGPLTQSSRTEEELLQMGYRYAGRTEPVTQHEAAPEKTEAQDDFYLHLNDQFEQQQVENTPRETAAPVDVQEQQDFFGQYTAPHQTESQDFSSVFAEPPHITPPHITYEQPEMPETPRASVSRAPYRARQMRVRGMPGVDWYLVLRILPYLCGVLFLVFLWSQRFAIAAALLELILAFVPAILVILGIVWLFRSIFHP